MSESIVRSRIFSSACSLSGNFRQLKSAYGHHHELGLASGPAAHVHVAVRPARPGRVHRQADAGLALLAVAAAPARDVERRRDEVALLEELDVAALLDDLARDLVAEDRGPRGAVVRPRTMCWSLPQMFVETIRRITPWWHCRPTLSGGTPGPSLSSKLGKSMSWTSTLPGPMYTTPLFSAIAASPIVAPVTRRPVMSQVFPRGIALRSSLNGSRSSRRARNRSAAGRRGEPA